MITVVSAAIVKDGRLLLTQRSGSTSHAFKWCTPGGKVEPHEGRGQALRRELREEIGIHIDWISADDIVYVHRLPSTRTGDMAEVLCYRAHPIGGTYACLEGTIGLGWFTADDLAHLPLAPADDAQRETLIAALRSER